MSTKQNPLTKHFRQPAIYVSLPSNGQYWPDDALALPANGEIPVYPMTGADEITLKTPDALMNGSAIVSVIQSCCPNIKNAWAMPGIDVDFTLIAIRIASYGQNMSVSSKCPHCTEEHDYDIDLTGIMSQIQTPNYSEVVQIGEMKFKFKPQNYLRVTESNIASFEEDRLLQNMNSESPEVKEERLKSVLKKVSDLQQALLVASTDYIETEDGERVREAEYIAEYYQNAEISVITAVQEHIHNLSMAAQLPNVTLHCNDCDVEYKVPLEFDYARFFEIGS
jgi:hypothetical protein